MVISMETDLVSILIPVFNGSKYLIEFLNSLKEQDYKKIQLVIRDDGSSDNSVEICQKWIAENQNQFFSVLFDAQGRNLGLSGNISELAKMAQGEFVFLADQDDIWLSNKVSYQVQYMRQHLDCALSLSDRSIADENMQVIEKSNYLYAGYTTKVMNFDEVVKHRGAFAANTMCIRNYSDKIFNLPNKLILHDTFIAVMASYYGTVDFIFEPLLLYRVHRNNLSGNFSAQFSRNIFECFIKNYKACKRLVASNTHDDKIIKDELMNRFQVNLDDYSNCFSEHREKSRVKNAWIRTRKAINDGKIGIWR